MWEINVTNGDLKITGNRGYPQMVYLEALPRRRTLGEFRKIEVPPSYRTRPLDLPGPAGEHRRVRCAVRLGHQMGPKMVPGVDHAVPSRLIARADLRPWTRVKRVEHPGPGGHDANSVRIGYAASRKKKLIRKEIKCPVQAKEETRTRIRLDLENWCSDCQKLRDDVLSGENGKFGKGQTHS